MANKTWSKEELIKAVDNSISISDVLKTLNLTIRPGNYATIKKYIKEFNIDTSHWDSKIRLAGGPHGKKIPLSDILIENSTYTNTTSLKKRLIKAGMLEYMCYECGINSWNNKPLSLQIEHINGNNLDHRIENLSLLCPNCHSQTPSFCRRKDSNNFKCIDCGEKEVQTLKRDAKDVLI